MLSDLGFGGADPLVEGHHFILGRDHADNVFIVSELQLGNAFKAFLQVRLNAHRVFGLGQDLQQFVIRQEEKPASNATHATYTTHARKYARKYVTNSMNARKLRNKRS